LEGYINCFWKRTPPLAYASNLAQQKAHAARGVELSKRAGEKMIDMGDTGVRPGGEIRRKPM